VLPLALAAMLTQQNDLATAGVILMLGALIGLVPIRHFLLSQLVGHWQTDFFRQSIQRQAKPALIGVVTVEATANAHSYLIILTLGPAALAPIAAAALFLRPMTLIQSSLAQIERPRLAKAIAKHDGDLVQQLMAPFYRYSIYAFVCNVVVVAAVALWQPAWLWPEQSSWQAFVWIGCLVVATNFFRSLRVPASTLVQCHDDFTFLARVTVVSSVVTIPCVILMMSWFGVLGALTAILVGELLVTLPIMQRSWQQLRELKVLAQAKPN
jgi:hypothetical protein